MPAWYAAHGDAKRAWPGLSSTWRTAGTEMAMPTPRYQTTNMIDRYLQRSENQSVFKEFYGSAKRNTIYTMQLRSGDGADGIISVTRSNPENLSLPPGDHVEWFDSVLWFGMTSRVGGIHLANLKMTERGAKAVGEEILPSSADARVTNQKALTITSSCIGCRWVGLCIDPPNPTRQHRRQRCRAFRPVRNRRS